MRVVLGEENQLNGPRRDLSFARSSIWIVPNYNINTTENYHTYTVLTALSSSMVRKVQLILPYKISTIP